MRYFYRDAERRKIGPYTWAELRELHLRGVVRPDTELAPEDGFEIVLFRDLWAQRHASASPGEAPPAMPASADGLPRSGESLAEKAGADLKAIVPHLLMPFEELKDFRWLENRRLLAIAGVGLLPLLLITLFAGRGDIRGAYWAVAFYFSALWGVFFYYAFPAPGIRLGASLGCFLGTGFFSISILLLLHLLPPLRWVPEWVQSPNLLLRLPAFVLGVGLPEEMCKALAVLIVARRAGALLPQTMLFYGLMSGLGFGIYEGVGYQLGRNYVFSGGSGEYYYLLNLIRLTTLPFLHATWTGIAGYFIGCAARFPNRRHGLWLVAIGLPALLHGFYNTFSSSLLGLGFALLGVLALTLYQAKSVDFEKALNR